MTVITTPIVLGEEYEDRISGFKGVATGIAEYLYGCRQVLLSKSGTGEVVADWFDEQRLIDDSPVETGGPQQFAPRRS